MGEVIGTALKILLKVVGIAETENGRKFIEQKLALDLKLQEARAKPYDQQDDQEIVALEKQYIAILEAVEQEHDRIVGAAAR